MKIRQLDLQSLLYQVNGLSVDHQIAMGVIRALENNALEIEGYERSEWTKFDPNDPKTFPPKGDRYLVVTESGQFIVSLFIDDKVIKSFWADCVTHWRPLPSSPVKSNCE